MSIDNFKPKTWIQTFTGVAFEPLNPDPDLIVLEDIAHALSNICRYTGHVKRFYSVAEHCVRVSWLTRSALSGYSPSDMAREGLLHDAGEAYLMDLANPIKVDPSMEGYRNAERRLDLALATRFSLKQTSDPAVHAAVKLADLQMLHAEKLELLGPPPRDWGTLPEIPPSVYYGPSFGWSPEEAKDVFLSQCGALGIE